jgi:ankyrin repeat protein
LIAEGCDLNLHDENGMTPLHFAAQSNSLACASALIAAGAEVDPLDIHGNTPLFKAVFNSRGHGDLIRFLRSKEADPEKTNHHGQSPIGLARLIANYDLLPFFD